MSERGSGKSRKSPASKALTSKQPASKAAKKSAVADRKPRGGAKGKTKTSAKRAAAAQSVSVLEPAALLARVVKLESERDRLLAELEKAESRIRALEEGRDQVLNRIDWVIDSLRSLIDTEQ
jgi:acyl-CoA reductase-like NAD-dependent aldehyde dehydrogenase